MHLWENNSFLLIGFLKMRRRKMRSGVEFFLEGLSFFVVCHIIILASARTIG